MSSASSPKIRDSDNYTRNNKLDIGTSWKKINHLNHGLDGLNDFTDLNLVKSFIPCHLRHPLKSVIKKLGEVAVYFNGLCI